MESLPNTPNSQVSSPSQGNLTPAGLSTAKKEDTDHIIDEKAKEVFTHVAAQAATVGKLKSAVKAMTPQAQGKTLVAQQTTANPVVFLEGECYVSFDEVMRQVGKQTAHPDEVEALKKILNESATFSCTKEDLRGDLLHAFGAAMEGASKEEFQHYQEQSASFVSTLSGILKAYDGPLLTSQDVADISKTIQEFAVKNNKLLPHHQKTFETRLHAISTNAENTKILSLASCCQHVDQAENPPLNLWNTLLGNLTQHIDFSVGKVAVFKMGNEGYRGQLALSMARILGLEDLLPAKQEITLDKSEVAMFGGKIASPSGFISPLVSGTETVADLLAELNNTTIERDPDRPETVEAHDKAWNNCKNAIHAKSYQEMNFFLGVLGEFDANAYQFYVEGTSVKNLDLERFGAPGEALVMFAIGKANEGDILPLLRNSLLDFPQRTMELTPEVQKRILSYDVGKIESQMESIKLKDQKEMEREIQQAQQDLKTLLDAPTEHTLQALSSKYGIKTTKEGLRVPELKARIEGKIRALKKQSDSFQSIDPTALKLQLGRIKRAQELIKAYQEKFKAREEHLVTHPEDKGKTRPLRAPDTLDLMEAMHPDSMRFYNALTTLGVILAGNDMGLSNEYWTCENIIKEAETEPDYFSKDQIQQLVDARDRLAENAIDLNGLMLISTAIKG